MGERDYQWAGRKTSQYSPLSRAHAALVMLAFLLFPAFTKLTLALSLELPSPTLPVLQVSVK